MGQLTTIDRSMLPSHSLGVKPLTGSSLILSFMVCITLPLGQATITGVLQGTNQGILQCKPCAIDGCVGAIYCKGGKLRGACNCCDVCAKVEGEICGGKFYRFGRCDKGLRCDLTGASFSSPVGKCVKTHKFQQVFKRFLTRKTRI